MMVLGFQLTNSMHMRHALLESQVEAGQRNNEILI